MFTLWSDIDRLFNRSFADWMFRDRAYKDGFGNLRMNLIDAGENLEFMAEIHYSDKETIKEKVDNIISIFNLSEVENQRSKTLSGGWKRKLSIAMALISNPKILFWMNRHLVWMCLPDVNYGVRLKL